MSNKWDDFIETPSIYREYRGEIFTTFHSEEHPVMRHIHYDKNEISIHGRFSKSYKGVLRGLHYDNKTWKLVLLVPPGFANGHYALTDCMFHYNLFYKDGYVDTDEQGVIKWNDPEYQMEWPTDKPILQKRDR